MNNVSGLPTGQRYRGTQTDRSRETKRDRDREGKGDSLESEVIAGDLGFNVPEARVADGSPFSVKEEFQPSLIRGGSSDESDCHICPTIIIQIHTHTYEHIILMISLRNSLLLFLTLV